MEEMYVSQRNVGSGCLPYVKTRFEVKIDSLSSLDIASVTTADFESSREHVFFAELYSKDGELIDITSELFCEPKHFKFLEPKIEISAKKEGDTVYLEFTSSSYARAVEVSFKNHDFKLSNNYFDLFSDTPRTVSIKTELSAEEILNDISIMSVYNIGR